MIEGAGFAPEKARIVSKAFDTLWSEIASRFPQKEQARLSLAHALLLAAAGNETEAEIKRGALEVMAQAYGSGS